MLRTDGVLLGKYDIINKKIKKIQSCHLLVHFHMDHAFFFRGKRVVSYDFQLSHFVG